MAFLKAKWLALNLYEYSYNGFLQRFMWLLYNVSFVWLVFSCLLFYFCNIITVRANCSLKFVRGVAGHIVKSLTDVSTTDISLYIAEKAQLSINNVNDGSI